MKIAVVRIRGIRNMKPKIKITLELLNLTQPNHCIIVEDTPSIKGMLNIIKDYVAYGPLEEKTLAKLLEKHPEGKVFRFHPPRKGYKDVRLPYPEGDLGKRKEMDSLLRRMM